MDFLKLFIIFLFIQKIHFGQSDSIIFGKISKQEMELTDCPFYKNAEAYVLYDKGLSYFEENDQNFYVIYDHSTKIKILNDAGTRWGTIEIPYYQEGGICETIFDLEVYTYNTENGQLKITKVDPKNAFTEKIDDNWLLKKIPIPSVKAGTIIEYRYKIRSQYKFQFRDWNFQWEIPVKYSQYRVELIPFYEYVWLLQGKSSFDEYKTYVDIYRNRYFSGITYNDKIYIYAMKNIEPYTADEFVPNKDDYLIKIIFQLSALHRVDGTTQQIISTWELLTANLLKRPSFGKKINKTNKVAYKIFNNIEEIKKLDEIDRFNYVINYVKENYKCNSDSKTYLGSKSTKELIEDRDGNVADINLFTIGLLNSVGIKAYPVILSTRKHGKIKYDYPFSSFFNYVIILAEIEGTQIFSDATLTLNSNFRIPYFCINDKGLIVKYGKPEWVSLDSQITSSSKTLIDISVIDSIGFKTGITKIFNEYIAYTERVKFNNNKSNILKELRDKNYFVADSNLIVNNYETIDKPFVYSYTFNQEDIVNTGIIYISPFLNESISSNPFKQEKRVFPIDFNYKQKHTFISTIHIPEGYQINFIPENKTISDNNIVINYHINQTDTKIIITLEYELKKTIYSATAYSNIKYYFNEIVSMQEQMISLKKI